MRLFLALLILLGLLFQAQPAQAADAERGRYLAILGDCAGCHTKPHGQAFAGGLPFNAQFGTVYSTNITPDRETGIGGWSTDDFYRALHEGMAPGGKHLYPAFPYIYFARITRQDTDDLFAFLHTLRPVRRPPTPNRLIFPANLRFGLIAWDWLFFDKNSPKVPAHADAAWRRGEYLVNGLGHCGACHTPKNMLFGEDTSKPLAGGTVDHWFAANLTGSAAEGLGSWSHDDVISFLVTGRGSHATAAGSMLEKVTSSTSRMRREDVAAIATYLKSLPPQPPLPAERPRPEQLARGQGFYRAHCQTCHAPDGRPRDGNAGYPSLAGDTLVIGHDPTTVLRLILKGGAGPVLPGHPIIKPMPGFEKLDEGQVADVASYIRNAWGNDAPAVSATQVHRLRQALGG